MVDGALTPSQRRDNLVAVTAAMAVTALIYGLSLPLLSLVMDARGVDSKLIGFSTAVQSIGILLIAPFLPRYLSRFGPAVLMLGSILVSIVAFMLLPVFPSIASWFVLRFVIGAAGGVLWVCGDAWVNEVATERIRGRVVAVYGVAVSGGFSLGPLLLTLTGKDGYAPYVVSSAIMLLSALPLLVVVRIAPAMRGERIGAIHRYLRPALVPMLMCLMYAISEAVLLTFLHLYGIERGLSVNHAVYLISVMGVGGMIGQFPIGWLADHMDRLLLGVLCILSVVVAAALIPAVIGMPAMSLALMLFLGATVTGIYTIGLVLIGEQFRGADLAAASALYGFMFGVGSVVGPPVGGVAMASFAPHGLPLSIALMYAIFLPLPVIALLRARSRTRRTS